MARGKMTLSSPSEDSPQRPVGFVPTRWTLVLRARGQWPAAQAALSELGKVYYAPVHAFIRNVRHDDDAARDLPQEFFARLLTGRGHWFPTLPAAPPIAA